MGDYYETCFFKELSILRRGTVLASIPIEIKRRMLLQHWNILTIRHSTTEVHLFIIIKTQLENHKEQAIKSNNARFIYCFFVKVCFHSKSTEISNLLKVLF